MFDLDKWTEIYASLSKHWFRTLLTAFGVAWGIFMLVLLLGFGRGFQNGVVSTLDVVPNAVFMWSQRTSVPYMGMKPGRSVEFTNEDVAAIRDQVPEAEVVSPFNRLGGSFTVNYENKSSSFSAEGVYPDVMKLRAMSLLKGRFINMKDIEEKRKIAIVGTQLVKEFFEEDNIDPIGKNINIKGVFFTIVGVHEASGKGEDKMEAAKNIYIPHTTMQVAYNQINRIFWFGFAPKAGVRSEVIETKIKTLLAQRHKISPDDPKAIGSANVEKEFERINQLFTVISLFSWFVSIMTIIAGVVGVSNIMLIVVRERTKEIGIRKALGATPLSIIGLIIREAMLLTSVAGYFGLLAGIGVLELINWMGVKGDFFQNPEVDLAVAGYAVLTLIAAGTFAGYIPAQKAARVNPIAALSDE